MANPGYAQVFRINLFSIHSILDPEIFKKKKRTMATNQSPLSNLTKVEALYTNYDLFSILDLNWLYKLLTLLTSGKYLCLFIVQKRSIFSLFKIFVPIKAKASNMGKFMPLISCGVSNKTDNVYTRLSSKLMTSFSS